MNILNEVAPGLTWCVEDKTKRCSANCRHLREAVKGHPQCTKNMESADREPRYKELPFDLGTAQEHPEWLYTRNGKKTRIICTDIKGDNPIAYVWELNKDEERVKLVHLNGCIRSDGESVIRS